LSGNIQKTVNCGNIRQLDFTVAATDVINIIRRSGRLTELLVHAAMHQCVMQQAAALEMAASREEVQKAVDEWRYSRGLTSAGRTHHRLAEQGWTVADLETALEADLLADKLRSHLYTERGDAFFASRREMYARARLSRLIAPTEDLAREWLVQMTDEGTAFAELACNHSAGHTGRHTTADLGVVLRGRLPAAVADTVFAAAPGDIVGPIPGPAGYELYHVEEMFPPELDPATAAAVRSDLFADWLRGQLAGARIEFTEA
jgi:parvulin-like peptidyl-prolyl isomerase